MSTSLSSFENHFTRVASYAAAGDLENLKTAIITALEDKVSINALKEVFVQLYAYAGFPRSINSLGTLLSVVEDRKSRGISDIQGEEPKELPAGTDKKTYGDNVQVELIGASPKGKLFDFAPAIDLFLKEHLFCDIFCRGILSHKEREIVTVAILSTIPAVEPQLKAHIQMALHIGVPQQSIDEILAFTQKKQ